jgi:hypothetical protein
MARRDDFIRVRLVPSNLGHATQVKVTPEERAALVKAASSVKYDLSTFIRAVGVAAAQEHHVRAVATVAGELWQKQAIDLAAADAHMNAGEWMRVVALSAIGFTSLGAQLDYARAAFAAGLPRDGDV